MPVCTLRMNGYWDYEQHEHISAKILVTNFFTDGPHNALTICPNTWTVIVQYDRTVGLYISATEKSSMHPFATFQLFQNKENSKTALDPLSHSFSVVCIAIFKSFYDTLVWKETLHGRFHYIPYILLWYKHINSYTRKFSKIQTI